MRIRSKELNRTRKRTEERHKARHPAPAVANAKPAAPAGGSAPRRKPS